MGHAILLVGGQGTRLRPLTIATPKPMLPVAGRPVTEHQIARAKAAGLHHVVLGTSYRAEVFSEYFGDGSDWGIQVDYQVETEPLGTGGAIRFAAEALRAGPDDPVVVFNGDVLTGLDIEGLIRQWEQADADVALYLTRVADPRAFGLVPTDDRGRVIEFREKPENPADIVTDQINAGCYVFRRRIIDAIAADRPVSVEREVFPRLLEERARVIGVVDDGYWLDLGTPLSFVRGSCDLVLGHAPSPLIASGSDYLVDPTAHVASSARVDAGATVGRGAYVGSDAVVSGSVIFAGAQIGAGCTIRNSIVGRDAKVAERCVLDGVVLADGVRLGADNELLEGARVFPHAQIADCALRFSSDRT